MEMGASEWRHPPHLWVTSRLMPRRLPPAQLMMLHAISDVAAVIEKILRTSGADPRRLLVRLNPVWDVGPKIGPVPS